MTNNQLALVFFVYYDSLTGNDFVLLSTINDRTKKTFGLINGYGGKCEQKADGTFESTQECAVREVKEELGSEAQILVNNLQKVGVIKNQEKLVDVFIVKTQIKFETKSFTPKDFEMVKPTWYDFSNILDLPLLPKNDEVMVRVLSYLVLERSGQTPKEFFVDKTKDEKSQELKIGERK